MSSIRVLYYKICFGKVACMLSHKLKLYNMACEMIWECLFMLLQQNVGHNLFVQNP